MKTNEKKTFRTYLRGKNRIMSIRISQKNKEIYERMAYEHEMTNSDFLLYLLDFYIAECALDRRYSRYE